MIGRVQRRKDQLMLAILSVHFGVGLVWGVTSDHLVHALGPGLVAFLAACGAYLVKPGSRLSRSVIAVSLMVFSGIFIHLSDGLIEVHFHVFVGLALLSIYYDWLVIGLAGLTICLHHLLGLLLPFYQVYAPHPTLQIFLLHVLFVGLTSLILCYQSWVISQSVNAVNRSSQVLIDHDLSEILQYVQKVSAGDLTGRLQLKASVVPVVAADELGQTTRLFNQMVKMLAVVGTAINQMGQDLTAMLKSSQESVDHINNLCQRILNSTQATAPLYNLPEINLDEITHKQRGGLQEQIEVMNARMVLAALRLDMLQHQLENKLVEQNRLNQELEEMSRLKLRFYASLSHELRTPLTAIMGYSELMLDEMQGPLNPTQQNSVKQVFQSALGMRQMINDILDFSKMQVGKLAVASEKVLLSDSFNRVLGEIGVLAQNKALQLTQRGADGLLALADSHRLHQILLNLLSNAVKFTPPNGRVELRAQNLRLAADGLWWQPSGDAWSFGQAYPQVKVPAGDWICIQVADSGIGIPADQMPLIFEEFQQLEDGARRAKDGTGLGLAIVKNLAHLMKGQVVVESTPGRGTVFSLLLPAYPLFETGQAPRLAQGKESQLAASLPRAYIANDMIYLI